MPVKTIAILTGGGDVPGLNSVIKTLTVRSSELGLRVLGIKRGWAGLLNYDTNKSFKENNIIINLNHVDIRAIDRSGGTWLHTSRTNPSRVARENWPEFATGQAYEDLGEEYRDYTRHILNVIEHLKIDVLVPIGGDDTLGYAARLDREGVDMISIPKTMDNDVYGTDICIGFSTAITRSVDFITDLRTNIGSHERIGIIELFGRHSGETSLISAYLAGADRAVISEVPFDVELLAELIMSDKRKNPSRYAIMTISEGATMIGGQIVEYGQEDSYGHKKLGGIGLVTSEALKKITGEGTIYQQIAYLMRSGAPDALDRMIAISFGNLVMEMIEKKLYGRMVAIKGGQYTHVRASTPAEGKKNVDVELLYSRKEYKPRIMHVLGMPMFMY